MGVLGFGFWYLCFRSMSFFVFILDAIFCGLSFSFSRTVCGKLRSLDEFIVVPIINSTGLAIVAEADLRCGDFLSEKVVITNLLFH